MTAKKDWKPKIRPVKHVVIDRFGANGLMILLPKPTLSAAANKALNELVAAVEGEG